MDLPTLQDIPMPIPNSQRLSANAFWIANAFESADVSLTIDSPTVHICQPFILIEPTDWASAEEMGSLLTNPVTDADNEDEGGSRSPTAYERYRYGPMCPLNAPVMARVG